MTCKGCDEKRKAAPTDGVAGLLVTAGKLRGFVEGAEWAIRCIDRMAPQVARSPLRTRLVRAELEAAVHALGPSIDAQLEARRREAAIAEAAARQAMDGAGERAPLLGRMLRALEALAGR